MQLHQWTSPEALTVMITGGILVAWLGAAFYLRDKRSKKEDARRVSSYPTKRPEPPPPIPPIPSASRPATAALPANVVQPRRKASGTQDSRPARIPQPDFVDPVYVSEAELRLELKRVLSEIKVSAIPTPGPGQQLIVASIERAADGDSGAMKKANTGKGTRTGAFRIEAEFVGGSWIEPQRRHNPDELEFRVMGADAWETGQGKAGALGADFARELLVGHTVTMLLHGEDDYGRQLADVFVNVDLNGREDVTIDYARALIRTGCGINYRGSKRPEGDPAMQKLEDEAHHEHIGRWQWPDDAYQLPHDWRRQKRGEIAERDSRALRRSTEAGRAQMMRAARACPVH